VAAYVVESLTMNCMFTVKPRIKKLDAGAGKTVGEDFVVFLRPNLGPVKRGNDGSVTTGSL